MVKQALTRLCQRWPVPCDGLSGIGRNASRQVSAARFFIVTRQLLDKDNRSHYLL